MNLDAKLAADTLRKMADFKQMLAFLYDTGKIINACADLIESLTAELEQAKRERDAAVKDLHMWGCFSCKHAGYAHSEICASCVYNRNRIAKGYVSGKNRYEWRGVKED
jgi:hypothetical protein